MNDTMIDEGHIYETGTDRTRGLQLQSDYNTLRPKQRDQIKQVATDANTAGHPISFDQLKSHRRWCIGRGLIDLLLSENFDTDLVRSVCFDVTGYLMGQAGRAVANLNADEAEQFQKYCQHIRVDDLDIAYDPINNLFTFPNKKKASK